MRNGNVFAAAFTALALLLAFAAVLTPAGAGIDGSISDSAFVTISLVNQNPDPVAPGELLELRFRIENRGTAPARDVVLELVPRFPYSVDEAERAKALGTLSGLQKGKDAVIVRFLVTVEGNSGSGIGPISLRYKTASQDWMTVDNINISIRQRDLPLSITSAAAQPEQLIQGKPSTLKLEITNFGTTDAINVRAKLNATSLFLPHGSANEEFISLIGPKGKATAEFPIITSPTAKSGIYGVPAVVTYSDSAGKNYTLSQSFGVAVGAEARLSASILDSDLLKTGTKRKVTIEIVNRELADVKFLTATLTKSDSYEILSPDSVYIGDMDSGDSDTVSYDVFFKKQGPLLLSVQYTDPFNDLRQQQVEVPVRIYTGNEIRAFGLEKTGGKGILITFAIVVFGVLAYRRLRRKK